MGTLQWGQTLFSMAMIAYLCFPRLSVGEGTPKSQQSPKSMSVFAQLCSLEPCPQAHWKKIYKMLTILNSYNNLMSFLHFTWKRVRMFYIDMPLWHKDYFKLKAIKKQHAHEKLFALLLKARHKFPFVKMYPFPTKIPGRREWLFITRDNLEMASSLHNKCY